MHKKHIVIIIFSLVFCLLSANSSVSEEDCNKFEDKVPCLATSGDTWAMYVMARREYDIARTTGDYSLAMEWAYKEREEKKVVVNRL